MIRDELKTIAEIRRSALLESATKHVKDFKAQAKALSKKIGVKADSISLEVIEVLREEFNIALVYNPDNDMFEQFIPLDIKSDTNSTTTINLKIEDKNESKEYYDSEYYNYKF
jgi:hypothetical protein